MVLKDAPSASISATLLGGTRTPRSPPASRPAAAAAPRTGRTTARCWSTVNAATSAVDAATPTPAAITARWALAPAVSSRAASWARSPAV